MRLIVVVLLCVAALCLALDVDPCELDISVPDTQAWSGSPSTLLACFQSIPFSQATANATLRQVSNLVDMYAFTDLVRDSAANNASYAMEVDLAGDLDDIEERVLGGEYTSDYDFQRDISKLFVRLRDAHTRYEIPKGYGGYHMKPFSLKASRNPKTGEMIFTLAPPGPQASSLNTSAIERLFEYHHNFSIASLVGKKLIKVDGVDTLAHLEAFAGHYVGLYKDLQVRFNALLRRGGFWQIVNVLRYGLDLPETHVFTLEGGKNVTVPTLAVSALSGSLNTSLILDKNKPKKAARTAEGGIVIDPHQEIDRDLAELTRLIGAEAVPSMEKRTLSSSELDIIYRTENDTWVYMVVDGKYPVFKLTTFSPIASGDENLTSSTFVDFLHTVNASFAHFRQHNYTELMVDVSRNGGGLICLAYDLLASLIYEWRNYASDYATTVYQPYDVRTSFYFDAEISSEAGRESYADNYGDPETRQYYSDNAWFEPPVKQTRGGTEGAYTPKSFFPFSCGHPRIPLLDKPGWPKNKLPYLTRALDKLIVITDGTCGSACSLFTTKLQTFERATVVSYGGIAKEGWWEPMETSSFAGGNVLDYEAVIEELQTLNISHKLPQVQPLPTSAYMRFNYHETYATMDSEIPREFEKIPADHHVHYWGPVWENSVEIDGKLNEALLNLYRNVSAVFPTMKGGLPGRASPWKAPVDKFARDMWIYVAAALGAVIVITVVAVIVIQMRRKRDDYPHVDYREQYERVPTDYAYE